MKTDLHTHSTASDGTLKPAELVTLADSCGVKLLALTDHDTVDGLPEAKSEAVKHGITFVPGIEVSTLWNERSIHVVGLGIRYEDGKLARVFADVAEKRVNRGKDIGKPRGTRVPGRLRRRAPVRGEEGDAFARPLRPLDEDEWLREDRSGSV